MSVHVLGCWERNVSIYLQQVRALNLAASLDVERVTVIGGGFAGLTVAAGLAARGTRVTLEEGQQQLLQWQRGNRTRWIHPHLHDWPRPESTNPDAGLPILNWQAGLAGDVAERVLCQFEGYPIEVRTGVLRQDLPTDSDVILALGLGIEKSFGALPLNSYWTDDSVSQPQETLRRYLVSGIGEGGVIDVLYLRLRDFCHARVVSECLEVPGMEAVRERLLETDVDFDALPVPPEVDRRLRDRLRTDTKVTLNGPSPEFLSPKADLLNRFLLHRIVRMGDIEYVAGHVTDITADFQVTIEGTTRSFDRVLIRHGTVPTLKTHFPQVWEAYMATRQGHFEEVVPQWGAVFDTVRTI